MTSYFISFPMTKRIIRLCYRKVIDASSQKQWDQYVFESTYSEYLLQSQLYDPGRKFDSFSELLVHVPGAEKLHFLVSAAVTGYLQQLEGKIPDILNSLGKQFLVFSNYRFEIINTSRSNKNNHRATISFFSEPMIWHDTIGTNLLLSPVAREATNDGVLTELFPIQPFVSIYSFKNESA